MVVKREKSILIEVGESMGKTRNEKRFNIETQPGCVFTASLRDFCRRLLSRSHFQRRLEPKTERGFGGKNDLLVSSKCCSARTRASAGGGANRCPLASTGYAADDGAERSATACHYGCPLPFALQRAADGGGFNRLLGPVYRN